MTALGKIEVFSIRNQFKSEAQFSKYLSNNLDILSRKLGLDLSEIEGETEVPVGRYRCDITGGFVAVENQFGVTDHDHLGKMLVYFANQDVKVGVWICETAGPQHIKSIQWLNERSEENESFYLLEAKVIKIGDSLPAVDFDLIVGPEFRDIGKERRRAKGVESKWTPALKEIGEMFRELKPDVPLSRPRATHLKILTGLGGIHYEWHIFGKRKAKNLEVALHFETDDKGTNKRCVEILLPFKEDLEKLLGEEVYFGSWSKRAAYAEHRWSKVSVQRKLGKEVTVKMKKWAAEAMVKMYEFLTPKIDTVTET